MKKYETFKTDYTLKPRLTERESSMRCMTRYTEETNPLPRSFSIKIHNPESARVVASNIEDKPWVETIKYNKEVVDTICLLYTSPPP